MHQDVAAPVLLLFALWIVVTLILVGAGELVTHSSGVGQLDRHITGWVVAHRSHGLDAAMRSVTWFGSWEAVAVTGGSLLLLTAARKLPLAVAILAAAGWLGEVTAVNLVKGVVDRQRPPQLIWLVRAHGGSFPSGHAANATLVFGTAGLVWFLLVHSTPFRLIGVAVSTVGALTVGFSRVELGVHWMTDVVAGWLAAGAWMVAIGLLFTHRLPFRASRLSSSDRGSGQMEHPDDPDPT